MNIGIDIDDTIVNTYKNFVALISMKTSINYNKLLSQNLTYSDLEKKVNNYERIKKDIFSILVKTVELKDNVIEVLNKLKSDGYKITLITARNYGEYDDPYKITYDFLTKNNVPYDKLIVNALKKDTVCIEEGIDLFIDDSIIHCNSVNKTGIKTFQYKTSFTPALDGVRLVSNWNEIYKIIKDDNNE